MDQEKIGKFIAARRKEQGLTQKDLADKLGITFQAVSKWENGRGMPEISVLAPLAEILGVSVNEILSGELIDKEEVVKKTDENIINTLNSSVKRVRKTRRVFFGIVGGIVGIVIFFVFVFATDINRMRNDQPVFFSTWGIDYAPPKNFDDEKIEIAVKDYLVKHLDSEPKHYEGEKGFAATRIYLLEGLEDGSAYNVYAWVLGKTLYEAEDGLAEGNAFSVPYKFVVKNGENGFEVTESYTPRDGSYYSEDMKKLFPKDVRRDMEKIHTDGSYEQLEMQISEQAKLYFH